MAAHVCSRMQGRGARPAWGACFGRPGCALTAGRPRAQMYNEVQYAANVEMERLLNEAAGNVRALLQRNRRALDAIIDALTAGGEGALTGEARPALERPPRPRRALAAGARAGGAARSMRGAC